MFKKLLVAFFALFLFSIPAHAVKVYDMYIGQWHLHGHKLGSEMSCVLSTYYPDGSQININVFPRYDGSQYTTMTVTNPRWNFSFLPRNQVLNDQIHFQGSYGAGSLNASFQVYTNNKLIIRNLTGAFDDYFRRSSVMIFFPYSNDSLSVGLTGTAQAVNLLGNCIATVKTAPF